MATTPPPAVAAALKVLCSHSEWLRERGSAFEKEHSDAVRVLSDHIQAGAEPGEERARAIKECMKALCPDCRSGRAVRLAYDGLWEHVWKATEFPCRAWQLRALLPAPAPATEGKQAMVTNPDGTRRPLTAVADWGDEDEELEDAASDAKDDLIEAAHEHAVWVSQQAPAADRRAS